MYMSLGGVAFCGMSMLFLGRVKCQGGWEMDVRRAGSTECGVWSMGSTGGESLLGTIFVYSVTRVAGCGIVLDNNG